MKWAWWLGAFVNLVVVLYCLYSGTVFRGIGGQRYTRKDNPIAYWSVTAAFVIGLLIEVSEALSW